MMVGVPLAPSGSRLHIVTLAATVPFPGVSAWVLHLLQRVLGLRYEFRLPDGTEEANSLDPLNGARGSTKDSDPFIPV